MRERAAQTEALRHVPEETIAAFREAGLLRLFEPARYGGYEMDYGRTQIALGAALGKGCGSSAWVQSVVACHAWLVGMYPQAVQDAVWGDDAGRAGGVGVLGAARGAGRTVDGGYEIEGQWQFSSGSNACQWVILGVTMDGKPPGPMDQLWCLLPPGDWEIVDTWNAPGLKGTGSNDIRVKSAFVPEGVRAGARHARRAADAGQRDEPLVHLPAAHCRRSSPTTCRCRRWASRAGRWRHTSRPRRGDRTARTACRGSCGSRNRARRSTPRRRWC